MFFCNRSSNLTTTAWFMLFLLSVQPGSAKQFSSLILKLILIVVTVYFFDFSVSSAFYGSSFFIILVRYAGMGAGQGMGFPAYQQ